MAQEQQKAHVQGSKLTYRSCCFRCEARAGWNRERKEREKQTSSALELLRELRPVHPNRSSAWCRGVVCSLKTKLQIDTAEVESFSQVQSAHLGVERRPRPLTFIAEAQRWLNL